MADTRIRQNEHCIVGLPSCGYVFSSTRSCFIAYGFQTSGLERDVLRGHLERRGIEAIEAGGAIDPGKYAFCTKICSKIITAQFCIVLMNHDSIQVDGKPVERPNANVNMEYGLMLGHNKYVIPFQRDDQTLPFNVSGLDTIKYNSGNFSSLASTAIDKAIESTAPLAGTPIPVDQMLASFCLSKDTFFTDLSDAGERAIFSLGNTCGFKLLTTLDGLSYVFIGLFGPLRPEAVIWRVQKLRELLSAREGAVPRRIKLGLVQPNVPPLLSHFFSTLRVWVLVTGDQTKAIVAEWAKQESVPFPLEVYTISEVEAEANRHV